MASDLTNPHDRFFKEIWSRKRIGQSFLRQYLPREVVQMLDLRSLELSKDSFVDEHLREHYSDLLYRLRLKDGTPGLVYALLEHKSQPKRSTAFQLLRYMVRIWEQALAQGCEPEHLPPIIPIVVYQGQRPWPYGQSLQEAVQVPVSLLPYLPDFRFELCDLSGLAEADIRGTVLLRTTLLVMKYIVEPDLAARLPGILELLRALSEKPTVLGYLETLLRYLAAAAKNVTEPDIRRALHAALPTLEDISMATLAQTWLEQGRAEGRVEGRAEGRAEGEQRMLIRLLERRFGPLPKAYRERIEKADTETLLVWGERVLSAQQLSEVFGE